MFDMILYTFSSVGNETSKTVLNFLGGAEQEAWEYMAVCVPIVVLCAPMGSLVASYFHRQGIHYRYHVPRKKCMKILHFTTVVAIGKFTSAVL